MIGKSVSYVTCQVHHDDRVLHACEKWQSPRVPQIPPLVGGLILVEANLTLCLNACPSVEVFVRCSGCGLGRPHSLPLVGGLYHAQQTLVARASRICPSLEDFVLHSGLWPRGPQELPLVGGLCHMQWTLTTSGLRKLPLFGGLHLAQRTLTTEGLKKLPLIGGLCLAQRTLTTMGLKDLPLVGGLCVAQRTLATRASGIAPRWRILSCTADFDHQGPTMMQTSLKDKWRVPLMVEYRKTMTSWTETTCRQAERWMDIMLHSIIIYLEEFACVDVGQYNDSRVGVSLSEEAWITINGASNAKGCVSCWVL